MWRKAEHLVIVVLGDLIEARCAPMRSHNAPGLLDAGAQLVYRKGELRDPLLQVLLVKVSHSPRYPLLLALIPLRLRWCSIALPTLAVLFHHKRLSLQGELRVAQATQEAQREQC